MELEWKWLYFILIPAFFISVFLAFIVPQSSGDAKDAYTYDTIALNLVSGNGYTNEHYQLTMSREPLYPVFLASIYFIVGYGHSAVKFVQIILFLLTVILTYKIAYIIFGQKTAKYAAALIAFFPTIINYPAYMLSETLAIFLATLFVFSCIKIYIENKLFYYILSGVVLGILILIKSAILPFILVLCLWALFFTKDRPKTILMVFISIVIILPWSYRNHKIFNTFSLRDGSEMALGIKAQKLNYSIDDFKKDIVFTISENLGKRVFPDASKNFNDFLFKEDILIREKILPELKKNGYSDKEIKNIMIDKIIKRPVKFLAISFLDLLKMMQFSYLPALNQSNVIEAFKGLPKGELFISLLRLGFRSLAVILILFSCIGMHLKRAIWRRWIFLPIFISYIVVVYSLIYGDGRYGVILAPFFIVLSSPVFLRIKEHFIRDYEKV